MQRLSHKQLRMIWLAIGVFAALLIAALSARSSALYASTWDASYWNNKELSGDPALVRSEPAIDHDWGAGSPAPGVIGIDNFSARWTRVVDFPTTGVYRFKATTDDGMRMWVDDVLIIDSWYDSVAHTVEADVELTAGNHSLRVDYYEAGGNARAGVTWDLMTTDGGSGTPITAWRGEYYSNQNLSGSPTLVRDDQAISFDWGLGSPAPSIPSDHFSVRWTRDMPFEAGRYRFTTNTDDGVRLWVNGQLVIDKWQVQAATAYNVEVDLPAGNIPIKMEYFEATENAVAQLSFVKVSGGSGSTPTTAWRGEYFNNRTLSGAPIMVRDDANINFNWGYGSPASNINVDNFSVRWTRTLNLEPGRYRFAATTDDGVRVAVNGSLIIDAWYDHAAQTFTGEVTVPGGPTQVRMDYYENLALAEAYLTWEKIDGGTGGPYPTAVVTASYLNIRSGPGVQYNILATLRNGNDVNLLGRNSDASWLEIMTSGGLRGWVNAAYLSTSYPTGNLPITSGSYTGQATATVTASHLNVRYGPGTGYGAFTVINQGYTALLLGRNYDGTWLKIRLSSGAEGWVNSGYVSTSVPISNLPVLG